MPRIPLEWPPRREHVARRRRGQHAGPQPHGAPDRAGQRPRRCGALGGLFDLRAWRPARPDRPHLPAPHLPRRAGRGAAVPEPAAAGVPRLRASATTGPERIARGGAAAVRLGQADPRDACGHLSAQPRHRGRARSARAPLPPALLLSRARGGTARDVAGASRCRHRPRRRHHRRAAHLARPRRLGQGAARNAAALAGASAWVWRARRTGNGCVGGRRGPGDDAVAPRRSAGAAHRRGPVGDAPGSVCTAVRAAAALHRPRQRPGRTPGGGDVGRACPRGRHRGTRARRRTGTTSTPTSPHSVAKLSPRPCVCSSHPTTRRGSWPWTGVRAHGRVSARPCRVRPRRRPRPAFRVAMVPEAAEPRNGCARLSSPVGTPARLGAAWAAAIPRETRKPCSPSSAALRPCRLRLWVRASTAPGFAIARRPRMGAASHHEEQSL